MQYFILISKCLLFQLTKNYVTLNSKFKFKSQYQILTLVEQLFKTQNFNILLENCYSKLDLKAELQV